MPPRGPFCLSDHAVLSDKLKTIKTRLLFFFLKPKLFYHFGITISELLLAFLVQVINVTSYEGSGFCLCMASDTPDNFGLTVVLSRTVVPDFLHHWSFRAPLF